MQRIGESLIASALASLPMLIYFLYVTFNWAMGDWGPDAQGWLVVMLPLALAAVFVPWAVFALAVSAFLSFPSRIANSAGVTAILITIAVALPSLNANFCVNPSYQTHNDCVPSDLMNNLLFWCAASGAGAVLLNQIFRRKRMKDV